MGVASFSAQFSQKALTLHLSSSELGGPSQNRPQNDTILYKTLTYAQETEVSGFA